MTLPLIKFALGLTATAAVLGAQAQPKPFVDVDKQEPITILAPSAP
jgi:hypothetical protein